MHRCLFAVIVALLCHVAVADQFSDRAVESEPASSLDLPGDGRVSRTGLSYSQLTGTGNISLQNYSQFALPANAANPLNQFSGTLTLNIVNGTLTEQGTDLAGSYTNPDRLPDFSFQFVQYGSHLIPVQRQLITTSHPTWEYLLLPGRVWQEITDNGYSRVALPFALQEVNANCTHNGVMTFLFKDDGNVSRVAYQIAQETCQYFKFNLHGILNASYQPATVSGAAAIKTAYVREVTERLPVKPLTALINDYPQAGIVLSNLGSDQSSSHLSAYGVYYNGVHYAGRCATRTGDYPFCEQMVLPSYSVAKSVVAGFALMRLEQKYAGNQRGLAISDYVRECAASRWADVSFGQTLDMATGNYTSVKLSADESAQATIDNFFLAASHQQKIQHACAYPRKAKPGSQFVYHSSDSYILSRAMQQYYRSLAGASTDYYTELLVSELWRPLQLSPLTYNSKRTYDAIALTWAGYGLSFISDDLIKLGRFAYQQQGQLNGQQLLAPDMLQDAMQRGTNGGLSAGKASSRYRYGFWAYNLSDSALLSCENPSWVPYMSGFGGIGVVMLPNKMVYYYVSDNSEYGFTKTVKELAKISPVCS
ncbi:serine hydrolase [Arsukibacterium indicum]|uniref:Beta-lactamase family protein n=1 Tax=Arsukibacterium indicum TaxID=2848612 RepID=A0ABS6MQJ4_9GAMM|nr:serine hydrolase domain-containing protein [Arsukibacterium indicum]MBV2130616.1 beta-lactamase family protein [Arsukibacterium indicum]